MFRTVNEFSSLLPRTQEGLTVEVWVWTLKKTFRLGGVEQTLNCSSMTMAASLDGVCPMRRDSGGRLSFVMGFLSPIYRKGFNRHVAGTVCLYQGSSNPDPKVSSPYCVVLMQVTAVAPSFLSHLVRRPNEDSAPPLVWISPSQTRSCILLARISL